MEVSRQKWLTKPYGLDLVINYLRFFSIPRNVRFCTSKSFRAIKILNCNRNMKFSELKFFLITFTSDRTNMLYYLSLQRNCTNFLRKGKVKLISILVRYYSGVFKNVYKVQFWKSDFSYKSMVQFEILSEMGYNRCWSSFFFFNNSCIFYELRLNILWKRCIPKGHKWMKTIYTEKVLQLDPKNTFVFLEVPSCILL